MKIRRIFLGVTALLGLSTLLIGGTFAQDTAPRAESGQSAKKGRSAKVKKGYQPRILKAIESNNLELTADQKSQIKKLTEKMMAERQEALKLEGAERSQKLRELGRKFRADVGAVLTAEQKDQVKKAMRKARAGSTAKSDSKSKLNTKSGNE